MLRIIIIFTFVFFAALTQANIWDDFFKPDFSSGPSFSDSQLYSIELGLQNVFGTLGAFGDFNSDKYTDIFVISENGTSIDVYLWNHEKYEYDQLTTAHIESTQKTIVENITNITPGDFNYDGKLDLLVELNIKQGNSSQNSLYLYFGELTQWTSSDPSILQSSIGGQLLVLDANADLQLDLFGISQSLGTLSIWENNGHGAFNVKNAPMNEKQLSIPNSNSFVDIDGDCLADLVVSTFNESTNTAFLEIWLNNKDSFTFNKAIELKEGVGIVNFGDMDGSGTIDLVIPVCKPFPSCSEENSIYIIYNNQLPLCKYLWNKGSTCRSASDLCVSDLNYMLVSTLENVTNSKNTIVLSGNSFSGYPSNHLLSVPSSSNFLLSVHIGDYNLDGFPDLSIPMMSEADDGTVTTWIELWKSVPCTIDICGADATSANLRTFSKVTEGVEALTSISYAYSATFVDFGENGVLDMLVLTDPSVAERLSSSPSVTKQQQVQYKTIQGVYNNFFNDAFFLKTMGLNGVCPGWCSSGAKFPDPKPYGVNMPGAVFKFTVSELSGTQRMADGVQLYRNTYQSLQTPYILFGLGRTNNYIEQLFMGVPIKNTKSLYTNEWICIIPNAQVVAFPYKPDDPAMWTLELYIRSSGLTLWIMVAVVSLLIINGTLICLFRWREKKQDNLLKQETLHLFSVQ